MVENRLPAVLARLGVSPGELARRTLLAPRLLARVRAPGANPALDVADRVAAALEVRVEALFRLAGRAARRRGPLRAGLGPVLAQRGWSDVRLARAAGLDRAHVNRLKNGRARPSVGTALAIARALGVDVADVFPRRAQSHWVRRG